MTGAKTDPSVRQCRNVMEQISIDTLHREGATLIVDIKNMLIIEKIDTTKISRIANWQ